MDFFSLVRRFNWRFREPTPARHRRAAKRPLGLERLEGRELLAVAPFVTNVTPAVGGTLGNSVVVTFSENVTGAGNASNYRLFDSNGNAIAIGGVTYNNVTFQATIPAANLGGGSPLVAGTYSLFLRGDQIVDLDDNLPVSRAGELVVADAGRGILSTVSLQPDGALGALTNYPLPPKGTTNPTPTAIALEDINSDGFRDLIVGNTSFRSVTIFLGNAQGEFSSVPDAELDLGAGATPTDFVLTDLNADNKTDLLVASGGTNAVLVFLNTAVGNEVAFSAAVSNAAGNSPNGIVLGRFNNDNFIDVAVSNSTVDASNNYTVNVLTGKGDGTFNATVSFIVGNSTPTDLTTPTGLVVGRFNNDNNDDLAVSGGTGISVLTNTSTAAPPTFTTAFVTRTLTTAGTVATSITTGVFRSNPGANPKDDILVATNDGTGQLQLFLNDGTGTFRPTVAVSAAVAVPNDVQARDLNGTGAPEIVYSNNAATGGLVSQSALRAGVVEDASNGTPIVITSTNHGLINGQRVSIVGVGGNTAANGTHFITNVTANTFTLANSIANGAISGALGTWVALPNIITNVTGNATSPIVITSRDHGLRSGQQVTIAGVLGNTNANGTFFITRIDADTFSLNATTGNGAYTAMTGTWSLAAYPTGGGASRLALGDTNSDGIADVVTANQTDHSVSAYRGSGTGNTGDGTFLASTTLPLTNTNPRPNSVAVGDLNKDGVPDLVATDFTNNRVNVMLGLAQGGYGAATSFSTLVGNTGREPVSVALGDVNLDGNVDIVVASQRDNVVSLLRGGGNGTFQAPTTISVGRTPTQVLLADMDKDGRLDLLVSHNGGGGGGGGGFSNRGVTFRRGVGDGTFFNSVEFASGTRAIGIATGDFNRDGNLDFAIAESSNNGPSRVRIRRGDGLGGFTNGGDFNVGPNPTDILVSDLNTDGFVDIITVSGNTTTTQHVSVLLNSVGTGFQTALHTTLPTATPVQSVAVVNANLDPFPDLVVGSATAPIVPPATTAPLQPNNVQVLLGQGNGTFAVDTDPFTVGGTGTPGLVPSYVGVINDPLVPLTTFLVGGNLIATDLVRNGNFDARDLTGEAGNLVGWQAFRLNDPNRGSAGQWSIQTGSASPLSLTQVATPSSGRYQAMLDQHNLQPILPAAGGGGGGGGGNPNSDLSYAGTHAFYQDIFIPANATRADLSLRLYINSDDALSDTAALSSLDYRVTENNQQVRVDIVDPTADILDVGTGVLRNLFLSTAGQAATQTVNLNNVNLLAFAGQTIRLRIASANNQGKLIVGLDGVRLTANLNDNVNPQIANLGLRNPNFLSDITPSVQSTDITLVGQLADNSTIAGIQRVTIDVNNDGFGNADDLIITLWDEQGRFSVTLPDTLLPGPKTVTARVTDRAGNFSDQAFNFIIQGPSLVTWTSQGPGPIDISAQGLNYTVAAGKITAIATDPGDSSGNTIYIGSANGGVWKTTNGGHDWQALTDNVTTSTGERVPVPVGALAVTRSGIVYAATGVEDNSFTSRSSIGILKSINDGRSWTVLGANVFRGAQVAKMVVDVRDDDVVYVAVTGWDDATKQPGIFKTTNGGTSWTNVLIPTNMFLPGRTSTLPANEPLASVTDLIIDPFNPDRLLIGLGNIGKRTANATAGVWKSIDGGQTWEKQAGGDNAAVSNGTIPEGTGVGRVTLAQGGGRVGDERFVYVLMSNPPTDTRFNQGTTLGLYKSKDNLLNFTKVMLTEEDPLSAPGSENFNPIELHGREGANVGALMVDPSNPNVVYVGGSRRFTQLGDLVQHALIRVDTGNMRDTTYQLTDGSIPNDGDDIDKAAAALAGSDKYPPPDPNSTGADYEGEGVYWYDIEMDGVNDGSFLRRLAPSIHALTFDSQGRLLIGTVHGLFRGNSRGYGYDFTTGGGLGIIRGRQRGFNPAGMDITQISGNLQIADLTSVAIDPNDRTRLYVSAADVGTSLTETGLLGWVSSGLNGNGANSDTPSAFQVRVAPPAPDAPDDALTTVYRVWQNRGNVGLIPESSADSGVTFGSLASAGISTNETAGISPVMAVNPTKVEVAGQFYDELLFGTSRVYLTRTSSNVWDVISPRLSATGFVSALAFAPSGKGVYYAGTDDGLVFYQAPSLNWPQRSNGLPTGVRINGLMVDPNNQNIAYAMLGGKNGIAHVYRTTNAGQSWQALGGSGTTRLPDVSAHTMVIDKRSLPGAPTGILYVGTDAGVYSSVDGGLSWRPFGQGLPTVPVVDLQFNVEQERLVAATQGRGLFVISTSRSGPFVDEFTPNAPLNGPLSEIQVEFNEPIDPRTFTTAANTTARLELASGLGVSPEYRVNRATEIVRGYLRRAPVAADNVAGLANLIAQPGGDAMVNSIVLSSAQYFTEVGGGTNATWIESAYLDLFGRGTAGDPTATTQLAALNGGTMTRRQVGDALVNTDEYRRNLAARLLNRYLGLSYPVPAPTNDARINGIVAALNGGQAVEGAIVTLVASEEAYAKFGTTYGTGTGNHATAVAFGNFTGARDVYQQPIPDLAVAVDGSNVIRIFRGRVGGGYDQTPALTLALPAAALVSDMVAADFNNDGMIDLAVANGGLSGVGSLSVFLNNRTAVGQLSFGARADLDGGNRPVAVVAANLDNDGAGNLDLATVSSVVNGANNFVASVLVGNGTGGFSAPTSVKVGDNVPNAGGITSPKDLAVGNVTGDTKLDLIVAGTNGIAVLTNTTAAAGSPTFAALAARLSNLSTTSVAAGRIDTNSSVDIVATSDNNGGELLVFQNAGASVFNLSTHNPGPTPRSVALNDFNRDGKLDVVAANAVTQGTVALLVNQTATAQAGADVVTFKEAVRYATNGDTPNVIALADTNQDGITDLAAGHAVSEHFTVLPSNSPAIFRTAGDATWLGYAYQVLFNRAVTPTEINQHLFTIAFRQLVTLSGPGGSFAPLAINALDTTGTRFALTFAPLVQDGTYTLAIGPNQATTPIKDFIDLNGTYVNIGNAMNQNRNTVNGEVFADRFVKRFVVTTSDTGRFIKQLYNDLLGRDPNGRDPDTDGFLAHHGGVESARQQALATILPAFTASDESRVNDIGSAYARFLRRPLAPLNSAHPEVAGWLAAIKNGQLTQLDLIAILIGSAEYFAKPTIANSNLQTWLNQVYLDLLGRPVEANSGWLPLLTSGAMTREQVARALLFSDEGLGQITGAAYLQFLGRYPNRNANPALDETVGWRGLLRQGPAGPGQHTPLEQMRRSIILAPEYLRVVGYSDEGWALGLYTRLLGRATVTATAPDVRQVINNLESLYSPQRQAVATSFVNSSEYRARIISRYYSDYLSPVNSTRVATSSEIAQWEAVYQANGRRLEAVLAGILALDEHTPLTISSNAAWLDKVYNSLLFRGTAGDTTAQSQLNFLNGQSLATLASARQQIALQIANSLEYRRALVADFYNRYLNRGKPIPPGTGDAEINGWANAIGSVGQEGVIAIFLGTPEYFQLHT